MSIILHIETATKNCSVALSHSGKLLALKENYSENYSHSEQLHWFIQKVLKKADMQIAVIIMNDDEAQFKRRVDRYDFENKISSIKKDILILHPGPVNRGVEITSGLVESNNSIILEQVENGVAIRMAIMYLLASKLNVSINE